MAIEVLPDGRERALAVVSGLQFALMEAVTVLSSIVSGRAAKDRPPAPVASAVSRYQRIMEGCWARCACRLPW